jgi:hypothetical protein
VKTASPSASTATWGVDASCPLRESVWIGLRVPAAERARASTRRLVPSERSQVKTASPSAATATRGLDASCPELERSRGAPKVAAAGLAATAPTPSAAKRTVRPRMSLTGSATRVDRFENLELVIVFMVFPSLD